MNHQATSTPSAILAPAGFFFQSAALEESGARVSRAERAGWFFVPT
jgi:hypothetical protein